MSLAVIPTPAKSRLIFVHVFGRTFTVVSCLRETSKGEVMKKFVWHEPTEKEIENEVLNYLNLLPGCLAFKVNTVGIYDQRLGIHRKLSKWVMPGTPDVIACYRGIFCGFEIKTRKGRQSESQKVFQERLERKANGFYFVVRTIKEVEEALTKVTSCLQSSHTPKDDSLCPHSLVSLQKSP